MIAVASDYQETKNIDQAGEHPAEHHLPSVRLRARHAADGDLAAAAAARLRRTAERLFVVAGAVARRPLGAFFDGKRRIATEKRGSEGLFVAQWHTRRRGRAPRPARGRDRPARRRPPRPPGASACAASRSSPAARAGSAPRSRARCAAAAGTASCSRAARSGCASSRRSSAPSTSSATSATARRSSASPPRSSSATRASAARQQRGHPGPRRLPRSSRSRSNGSRTNYLGGVWCLRAFLPALEAAAPSDVVNVVSVAGTVAAGSSGPYTASKHAQLAFSRSIAVELRPRGIRRAHDPSGLRRDGGLPPALALRRRACGTLVAEPELVAERWSRRSSETGASCSSPAGTGSRRSSRRSCPGLLARVAARAIRPARN